MVPFRPIALAAFLALAPLSQLAAQQRATPGAESALPAPLYADYADLVLGAPVIADATVRSTARLKPAEAPGLAPGQARLYLQADIGALIQGPAALSPRIGYTIDVPVDARGRVPKLNKTRVLLFARPVVGAATMLQLVRPDGQRLWAPDRDALVRRIAREVLAPDAPPEVTGVGRAFHTAGDLPGSGETQIFLTTADHRPISLAIRRTQGEAPRWAVALGDIVDEAAGPPAHDTLLWYRLVCALPAVLPDESVAGVGADDAQIAREDYAVVLASLGRCDRGAG